jgi:RNA recognition motif-containing protein
MSSLRRRGQAWVVFRTVEAAIQAQAKSHGHLLFGKKMRVSFSCNISDMTRSRKGIPPRRKTQEPDRDIVHSNNISFKSSSQSIDSFFNTNIAAPKTAPRTYSSPSKLLLIENLPENVSLEALRSIFSKRPGFVEVRLIPSRGIAFIEFTDEHTSAAALTELQDYPLQDGMCIHLSYARR